MTDQLRERYQALLHDSDPLRRAMAREQLAALGGVKPAQRQAIDAVPAAPTPEHDWPLAVLIDVFQRAGNRLLDRGDRYVTGHEPVHESKSAQCLVIWKTGRWWCSACKAGGDVVNAVRVLEGCSYPAAIARLHDRYPGKAVRDG